MNFHNFHTCGSGNMTIVRELLDSNHEHDVKIEGSSFTPSINFHLFGNRDNFTRSIAPFASRSHDPKLFRTEFHALALEDQAKSNEIWMAFLTPTVL